MHVAMMLQAAAEQRDLSMPWSRRLLPILIAVVVLTVAVELIRRRKLREQYALLWLGTGLVLLVFAIFPQLVLWLEATLKIDYRTLVALTCFGLLALIVMQLSTVVSTQAEQIRKLAQQLALLHRTVEEKQEPDASNDAGAPPSK